MIEWLAIWCVGFVAVVALIDARSANVKNEETIDLLFYKSGCVRDRIIKLEQANADRMNAEEDQFRIAVSNKDIRSELREEMAELREATAKNFNSVEHAVIAHHQIETNDIRNLQDQLVKLRDQYRHLEELFLKSNRSISTTVKAKAAKPKRKRGRDEKHK